MMIDLLPAIAIALSSKLLRSEYCTNAINDINNHEMLRMLIPLFRIPHFTGSHFNISAIVCV